MYPPRKDSSAIAPLLPQPAASSRFISSRWRPSRRVFLLVLAVGASAVLWSLSGTAGELQIVVGDEVGGSKEVVVYTDEQLEELDKLEDEAIRAGNITFSPRLPCNALTTTIQTLSPRRTQTWFSPSPPLPPSASLDDRLSSWLSSPLANHTTWTRFNRQTCGNPSVRRNMNRQHFEANRRVWEGITPERVRELREEMTGVLSRAEGEGRFDEWKEEGKKGTRGIVWTAGNADTFDRVLVSLRLLRHSYNTTLPATIFHFPSETPSPSQLADFSSLNATVLPLSQLQKDEDPNRTKSFHLKGAAIIEAPYDEVLMLDSDNVPVRDVTGLWESPEFREMGVVLWPDYWKDQPENAIWSILGIQCRDEFTTEAGQLLIRKSQHLDALLLVEHWLKDWQFWFQLSDGDKDLFRYALLSLRRRWAVPSRPLSPASWTDALAVGAANRDKFAGHTMVQYGLASELLLDGKEGRGRGRPLFVHANLLKRVIGNVDKGSTWGRTLQLRLPSSPPSSSSVQDSSIPFVLQADHLLNPSPFTGLGYLQTSSPSSADPNAQPVPLPRWVTEQNLLTRSLSTHFWDGHRSNGAYVLATEVKWRDELRTLPSSPDEEEGEKPWEREGMEQGEWDEWVGWVEREREARCQAPGRGEGQGEEEGGRDLRSVLLSSSSSSSDHTDSSLSTVRSAQRHLEVVLWAEDTDLRGFEERFYEVGMGVAGGVGFRQRRQGRESGEGRDVGM